MYQTIEYHGKQTKMLVDNGVKKQVLDSLQTFFGTRWNYQHSRQLPEATKNPPKTHSWIMPQSTGYNAWLILTKIAGEDTPLLIEKRVKDPTQMPRIFRIPMMWDATLFVGTLFSVEVIFSNSNCTFLFDDVFLGTTMFEATPYSKRYETLTNILRTRLEYHPMISYCSTVIKPVVKLEEKVPYTFRGYEFRDPNGKPFLSISWYMATDRIEKPKEEFMLCWEGAPDLFIVKKAGIECGYALIQTKSVSLLLRNKTEIPVKCSWNPEFEKWQPIELLG